MIFNFRYRYLFLLLLSVYTYLNTAFCRIYDYFHLDIAWYLAFAVIVVITFASWEINRLLYIHANKIFRPDESSIRSSIYFFLCGCIISCILTTGIDLIVGLFILRQPATSLVNPLKMTLTYTTLINLLFHLLHHVSFYQVAYQKQKTASEEAKKLQLQTELFAIKQQINPHFLFNNLNVLSGLVQQKSNDAESFINAFSQTYRYILSSHNKELITLGDELDCLQPYIFLLQQRFPHSIVFNITVEDKFRRRFIIPVALQMLVENAVKHNSVSSKKPLKINIDTDSKGNLNVTNNLQQRKDENLNSNKGLQNIQKRYQLTAGLNIHIDKTESHFTVSLPLIQINTYAGSYS